MNKSDKKIEFRRICNEWTEERNKVAEKAKAEGIYVGGLDGHNKVFAEVDAKYQKMIEELKAQIDEE